jgi:hypothetical protein
VSKIGPSERRVSICFGPRGCQRARRRHKPRLAGVKSAPPG